MAIADTINSMYENVGEVYDTITNVDINTGKNLFDNDNVISNAIIQTSTQKITWTNEATTIWLKVQPNTQYTMSRDRGNRLIIGASNNQPVLEGTLDTIIYDGGTSEATSYTFNSGNYTYIAIYISRNTSTTPSWVMINKGTSALPYEPYTDTPTYKNIQNIPSTMRNSYLEIMNNGIDKIWNNWEKVEGTGETLTLNSTEEAPMKTDLKGNTSQETTTGKNKYNATRSSATTNTVTYSGDTSKIYINGTPNNTGRIFFNKTYLEAGTYTFSATLSKGSFTNGGNNLTYLYLYKGTETTASWDFDTRILLTAIIGNVVSATFTISEGSYYYLAWYLDTSYTWTNAEIKYQVESGSSFTSFEPYTGGQASPNPDYPQDIHVVSGDNSIEVCGKNLLKLDFVTERPTFAGLTFTHTDSTFTLKGTTTGSWTIFNLKEKPLIENGATYTFSANITGTNPSMTISCYFWNKSGQQIDNIRMSKNNNYEITKTINFNGPDDLVYSYATFVIESLTNNSAYDLSAEVQLERNNTKTNFEPYSANSYNIDLPIENLLQSEFIQAPSSTINANLKKGTYTIATCDSNNFGTNIYFKLYDSGGNIITSDGHLTARQFNFSSSSYSYYGGSNGNNVTFTIDNDYQLNIGLLNTDGTRHVMLVKGNEAIRTYTPYGTTPIELCKIGDYQDSIKKSTGKNLCNTTFELGGIDTTTGQNGSGTDRVRTKDYVEVKPNTTYTLSGVQGSRVVCFYNSSKAYLSYEVVGSQSTSGTFITPNDTSYIRWYIIQTNTNINEMLNEGTTALPYEPYGTSWYLNKQIGKRVLDGTESWGKSSKTQVNRYFVANIFVTILNASSIDLISNYFVCVTPSQSDSNNIGLAKYNENGLMNNIPLSNTELDTLEKYKTWLSTHNTTVYYVLATPTTTEITDSTLLSQLEAVKRSFNGQTNITQTNNDKPFILDVTALKQLTQ